MVLLKNEKHTEADIKYFKLRLSTEKKFVPFTRGYDMFCKLHFFFLIPLTAGGVFLK